jgi:hypothetical protein
MLEVGEMCRRKEADDNFEQFHFSEQSVEKPNQTNVRASIELWLVR